MIIAQLSGVMRLMFLILLASLGARSTGSVSTERVTVYAVPSSMSLP